MKFLVCKFFFLASGQQWLVKKKYNYCKKNRLKKNTSSSHRFRYPISSRARPKNWISNRKSDAVRVVRLAGQVIFFFSLHRLKRIQLHIINSFPFLCIVLWNNQEHSFMLPIPFSFTTDISYLLGSWAIQRRDISIYSLIPARGCCECIIHNDHCHGTYAFGYEIIHRYFHSYHLLALYFFHLFYFK